MNKANRLKLLALARWLDARSAAIRSYVKASTPKRVRKSARP